MFNLIKPFAGFLGTNENAYYAYGGFGIDGYYGKKKNFVVTPSLACGLLQRWKRNKGWKSSRVLYRNRYVLQI